MCGRNASSSTVSAGAPASTPRGVTSRPGTGPGRGVYGLFRRWQRSGVWAQILTALQASGDAAVRIVWDVSVDSTIVRAHQHAAGARRSLQLEPAGGVETEPDDHAPGRSRGGWSTKLHLGCEQDGRPLAVLLTPGQHGDSPQFTAVLERIRVPRLGSGRARTGRCGCWRTRPTVPAPTAPTCVDVASERRSRSRPISSRTAADGAREVDVPQRSTVRYTGSGTRSSAASTSSNSTGRWPPATTSSPCVIWPPSTSLPSTGGYESEDI